MAGHAWSASQFPCGSARLLGMVVLPLKICVCCSCVGPSGLGSGCAPAEPGSLVANPVLLHPRTLPGERVPHRLWPVCRESAARPLARVTVSALLDVRSSPPCLGVSGRLWGCGTGASRRGE